MPAIFGSDVCTVVTAGSKVIVCQNTTNESHILDTDIQLPCTLSKTQNKEEIHELSTDCSEYILTSTISKCGQLLSVCTNNKQLLLWKRTNAEWNLVSARLLHRLASKVAFTPSGCDIVVADKSGDVYLFSVDKPDTNGQLIMGHLSMLLDVLITVDEKYIITCDRDEKIRVSLFPNAYNIHTYCLGHEEFVTKISLLPTQISEANLISGSGDGSLRLWNYITGREVHKIWYKENVDSELSMEENENLSNSTNGSLKSDSNSLSVTNFSLCKLDPSSMLLAVTIHNFKGCIIFKISATLENIISSLFQILKLEAIPWDIYLFSNELLWVLNSLDKEPLKIVSVANIPINEHKIDQISKRILDTINNSWPLFEGIKIIDPIPTLYKRKLDNVQEYQERKKQRLLAQT